MGWKVMVSAPYMQPVIDRFTGFFNENDIRLFVPQVRERLEEAALLPIVGDIDGVICGDDRFTAKVLNKAKKLKVIAKWGTGIDSIDAKEARKLGIMVYNTPSAFTDPVADTIMGYILSFARQVPWSTELMHTGKWQKIPCFALKEKILGVIGVGNIGQAVIKRAAAFGMKTIGNDPAKVPSSFLEETGAKMVSKQELLKTADFISVNCDLNPTSYHLLGDDEFSLMKQGAYIINTARGPIIDEAALIRTLKKKRIAGAGLDVFEVEPLAKNSPLRKMKNCLLASHNANSSPTAWEYVHRNTLDNLLRGLREGKSR